MIDEKRIAEIRQWESYEPTADEIEELVEVYEAARAYANQYRSYAPNWDDRMSDARSKLTTHFPEAPHG